MQLKETVQVMKDISQDSGPRAKNGGNCRSMRRIYTVTGSWQEFQPHCRSMEIIESADEEGSHSERIAGSDPKNDIIEDNGRAYTPETTISVGSLCFEVNNISVGG